MITHKITVRLHQTDAAGVMFFASQFFLIHDAYEAFLDEIGFPMRKFFTTSTFYLPIVHSRADFMAAVKVGQQLVISVQVAEIGQSSFTMDYQITDDRNRIVGTAQTVHVSIGRKKGTKIALPDELRAALKRHTAS